MRVSILLLTFLVNISVFANYGDSFGIGTRNNFLGGAADVTDGSSFASVGNPAVLVNSGKSPFDLSFRTNQASLENVNLTFKNQPLTGLPNDDYKSENAGNMMTFSGGGNLPLGNRLVIGGSILIPLDSLARVYAFSGNESNYLHYMDRQSRPEIYTGVGVRIFDWFSMGAGFFGSVKANGTLQTGITQENAEARVLLELKPVLIPYGGILFEKNLGDGKLLFGSNFRPEHSAETNLNVDMRFVVGSTGTLPFSADSQLVAFYDPAKLSFGFGYQTNSYGIYLSTENTFWSGYKSNIVKLGGSDLNVLTTGQSSISPIKLRDSWSFKSGFELKNWGEMLNAKITNQFGFEYYQSALPKNPSSLSLLDTDRYVFDAGFSFGVPGIKDFISKQFNINFGGKFSHLVTKDFSIIDKTGNVISAKAAGNIISLIAGLSFEI